MKAKKPGTDLTEVVPSTEGQIVYAHPCRHPSGFLFLRRTSPDGVTVLDLMYCPVCGGRRRVTENGRVVASCAAGAEWRTCP